MRYFLKIAYKGTRFHGWQKQNNANTIQNEIEKAICTLTSLKTIETTGCGRTDTGVHANDFYLHFDIADEINDLNDFVYRLNRILDNDIACIKLFRVDETAHARFDAISRSYAYHIHHKKNPFISEISTYRNLIPDYDIMNIASQKLLLHNNFASFCKSNSNNSTTICKITQAYWHFDTNNAIFNITADRFLRNMVRAIVGTLLQVGHHQITINDFESIIQSGKRNEAGDSVPPQGLFLNKVVYPYID